MLLRWGFVLYALLGCLLFNLVYSSAVEEAVAEPQVALDESKVFVQPSQDVVLLSPHYGLEVPGTKGVMRVILGLCLMLGTLFYIYSHTFPKIVTVLDQAMMHLQRAGDKLAGEKPRSKAELILERVQEYAEKNPEEVALHASGLTLGILLFLWGVHTMHRPRKLKFVGI